LAELERLPGIGFILAQNIIAYRDSKGSFTKIEDLQSVDGVSLELIDYLKDRFIVESLPLHPAKAIMPSIPDDEDEATLYMARLAIQEGEPDQAINQYNKLIQQKSHLDEIIADIQKILYKYPVDVNYWQALGDAYIRNNQLDLALEAYNKVEELLR
jgi:competence ComEA-like helix-hairpin-helix protein